MAYPRAAKWQITPELLEAEEAFLKTLEESSIAKLPDNASRRSKEELVDRIKGLVWGQAIGDAVGLATEFMSRQGAEKYYGPIVRDKGAGYYDYHYTS